MSLCAHCHSHLHLHCLEKFTSEAATRSSSWRRVCTTTGRRAGKRGPADGAVFDPGPVDRLRAANPKAAPSAATAAARTAGFTGGRRGGCCNNLWQWAV